VQVTIRDCKFEGKTNEEIDKITRKKIEGCKMTAQNILYFRSDAKLDIPLEEIYKRPPKK
jgi:hypothetical protein